MVSGGNKVNPDLRPAYHVTAKKVSELFTSAAEADAPARTVTYVSSDSSVDSSYESDYGSDECDSDAGYCYHLLYCFLYDGFMLPCCSLLRYNVGHFGGTYIPLYYAGFSCAGSRPASRVGGAQ